MTSRSYSSLINYILGLAIICFVVTPCTQESNNSRTARYAMVAGVVKGKIYLIGGITSEPASSSLVEEYDSV